MTSRSAHRRRPSDGSAEEARATAVRNLRSPAWWSLILGIAASVATVVTLLVGDDLLGRTGPAPPAATVLPTAPTAGTVPPTAPATTPSAAGGPPADYDEYFADADAICLRTQEDLQGLGPLLPVTDDIQSSIRVGIYVDVWRDAVTRLRTLPLPREPDDDVAEAHLVFLDSIDDALDAYEAAIPHLRTGDRATGVLRIEEADRQREASYRSPPPDPRLRLCSRWG